MQMSCTLSYIPTMRPSHLRPERKKENEEQFSFEKQTLSHNMLNKDLNK